MKRKTKPKRKSTKKPRPGVGGAPLPTREEQAAHFAALALGYRALARMGTNQEHFMALAHEARASAAELGCNIVFKDDKVGT